jgi:hypothetical protein
MITDALRQIDPTTMVLSIFFVGMFALLMFILGRTALKENHATRTIISLCISLLSVYGLTRTNFNITDFVFSLGVSEDIIYFGAPILLLLFVFFLSRKRDPVTGRRKFSLGRFFIILGAIFIVLGFTSLIYQKAFMIIVGAGLAALGGIIANREKLRFPKGGGGNNQNPPDEKRRQQGIEFLTNASRRFKKWALSTGNPKFYGSWAMFINWLGKGGHGRSESEICQKLGITQNDFVRIFNRYGKV